jgi:hypothetical protein
VDCVVELVRQLLLATRSIELREVKSYEIRPVDFVHVCQFMFKAAHIIAY